MKSFQIALRLAHDVQDMPELMAWADLAVASGGSTSWETAFMGLPTISIAIAENQQRIVDGLHAQSVAIRLGFHPGSSGVDIALPLETLIREKHRRKEMRDEAQRIVDGYGVARTLASLTVLASTLH